MLKNYLTLLFFLPLTYLIAQPQNDNCGGLIDLGTAPACQADVTYTNLGATPSDIGFGNIPGCFINGTVDRDVWFAFTSSDTIFDYTITVNGQGDNPLQNPQLALYRGDCSFNNLGELACATAPDGETEVQLDIVGLTPGITYFIRINDYSSTAMPNSGDFNLCIEEIRAINTIDEGGSNACSGELFDSGGPDGDYGNLENNVFTICPTDFHNCINFTLTYYNLEEAIGLATDQLLFYDGPSADPNTLIAELGGSDFDPAIDYGGGGVCFQVMATSGCLTIQFISDSMVTQEGFAGQWECAIANCDPQTPLELEAAITELQISEAISTPLTQAVVTDINCPDNSYGIFNAGDNTNLGLDRGLLLTTGDLNWAVGPNNDSGNGNSFTTSDNGALGDSDLDYLSSLSGPIDTSLNACIIEVDVLASSNELTFEYVFASEEYPEFVNDTYNDIFAFLISGPGIAGDPNINNQRNIAILPNGQNTPVEINSVNQFLNWEYYRNNRNGQSLQYDGLTSDFMGNKKSLTAVAQVQPCNTYHLKFAIADRDDPLYDSGVFIAELRGGTPDISLNSTSGIDYLLESCDDRPNEIVVTFGSAPEDTIRYNFLIGGTAVLGVDYEFNAPNEIVFLPGETEKRFPITAFGDLQDEGTETITLTLVTDFGCGEVTSSTLTIELREDVNTIIDFDEETAFFCPDSTFQITATGAETYFWTPVNIVEDPSSPSPIVSPTEAVWLVVEGTVGTCSSKDSIFLQPIAPEVDITALDPVDICLGDSIQLLANNNVGDQGLFWTPEDGIDTPFEASIKVSPEDTTTYFAVVDLFGCQAIDSITVNVSSFDFPTIANDTTVCQNYPVQLGFLENDSTTTIFNWTPATGLDDPNSPTPLATPNQTTTYTLLASNTNSICEQTAQVTVTIIPADVDIQPAVDTVFLCVGETVDLSATISEPDSIANLFWSPNNETISDTVGLNVTVNTLITDTYFTTFTLGACTVFDSIVVRVDSLPSDLSIMADPEKDPYCIGETVTLVSPIFEPSEFPDIEHLWVQGGPGYETPDTLYNMVITTQDTFLYTRITIQNACTDTSQILINVEQPPMVSITTIPDPPEICEGEVINVSAQGVPPPNATEETYTWMWPGSPEVPGQTTEIQGLQLGENLVTVTYDVGGNCGPGMASVNVLVKNVPGPIVPSTLLACPGDEVTLNTNIEPNVSYQWSSSEIPDFNSTEPDPVLILDDLTEFKVTASQDGCVFEDEFVIDVLPEVTITLVSDTVCIGEEALVIADIIPASRAFPESFSWQDGAGNEIGTDVDLIISQVTGPQDIRLVYTYGEGCGPVIAETSFGTFNSPAINRFDVLPSDSVIIGTPIDILVNDSSFGENVQYVWSFNGESFPNATGNSLTGIATIQLDPGPVVAAVTITNTQGCSITGEQTIILRDALYRIPNAFTPNGDGLNDNFTVITIEETLIIEEFQIFNRWGQVVHDSPDLRGWDGQFNGNPAPSDVYIYNIKFKFNENGAIFPAQGDVTLIR